MRRRAENTQTADGDNETDVILHRDIKRWMNRTILRHIYVYVVCVMYNMYIHMFVYYHTRNARTHSMWYGLALELVLTYKHTQNPPCYTALYSGIRKCRLPSSNGIDEHVRRGGRTAILRANGLFQSQVVRQMLVRILVIIVLSGPVTHFNDRIPLENSSFQQPRQS